MPSRSSKAKSAQRRRKHYAVHLIAVRLYDEDAELAQKVQEWSSFNMLVTWVFRYYIMNMQSLVSEQMPKLMAALPEFANSPPLKSTIIPEGKQFVMLEIQDNLWNRFRDAAAVVSRQEGKDVGIEELMVRHLEKAAKEAL